GFTESLKRKILEGEVKKIVIVFTDGVSDNSQRVKNILEKLRKGGIVALGVGVTESGAAALDTYAPDARLAETAEKLPLVLGDLLKKHLVDI
ncbi:MAG: VWA domain-containing protein, partial [Patescibacteria group bacterium]